MSTEIKNTLFSFVTMRAPGLVDDKSKQNRFVFRQKELSGPFDEAVANRGSSTKMEVMKSVVPNPLFTSEKALYELSSGLYDFSIWIARNRSDFNKEEFFRMKENASPLNNENLTALWNNLFYQVINQKDFYVKDAIMHMLVGNNLLLNYNDDSSILSDLMHSTVVLPKSLFIEDIPAATSARLAKSGEVVPSYPDIDMLKTQTIAAANLMIEGCTKLLKELVRVEKKYLKEYASEYKKQKDAYDLKYKSQWDSYYRELEEAKKSFCAVRDPKNPYDPTNPCDQPPYVAMPSIPGFEFDFRDALDISFLRSNLSEASFAILMDLVGMGENYASAKSSNITMTGTIEDFETFEDISRLARNAITTATNNAYDSTPVNAPEYISYGGVVVPLSKRTVSPFVYSLCYKKVPASNLSSINFDLTFDVPDSSWRVTNFYCIASFTEGEDQNGGSSSPYPFIPVDQKISITNIFSNTGIESNQFRMLTKLHGVITFANGCTKTFTYEGNFTTLCVTGTLEGDCIKKESPTAPSDDANLFVPSGHGFKQLGIADYKVVEQTIHCYVEGEVAHIENVMARERREKSTRRLLKTETTTSEKSESERESTTDTATTERYEMQNEVSQVIQQSKDLSASTDFHVNGERWSLNAGMGMASHSSKEQNTRQAITNAKEIVQKATERITTKVQTERIQKITEEFEENNIHEFDNRKGDKHVVGVYRWVDRIYKNQIINYGKRLMFEFMVPEPARLHKLGMVEDVQVLNSIPKLTEPIDPRVFDLANGLSTNQSISNLSLNLNNFTRVNETRLKYWAAMYNVEFKPKPVDVLWAGKTIHKGSEGSDDYVEIPKGYRFTRYRVKTLHRGGGSQGNAGFGINGVGAYTSQIEGDWPGIPSPITGIIPYTSVGSKLYQGKVPVSGFFRNADAGYVHFDLEFVLDDSALKEWQQECFKAIIDKYEEAKADFDEIIGREKETAIENKETNPAFFRQMMNLVLRKNCISYLIDQTPNAKRTYGKDMSNKKGFFTDYEVNVDANLDDYGAFVKFIEQAFEWNIMSYSFYPYYWANRDNWKSMYQFNESDDPLFRSFMQSGMARVIVTVRPGFEEAVRFYMQTGKIWNGGEVPVIEDKLFISIVEELRETAGKKEGKAWATRVPTSLTILQANSIGLVVEKALPCNCEDLNDFEDPKAVPCGDSFTLTNAQINGATNTSKLFGKITGNEGLISRIMLKTSDNLLQDMTNTDANGEWELKNIPAGTFTLFLDALNVFPDTDFVIESGEKEQDISLEVNEILEVNLKVKKR
ncbi:hypothetical protein [Flavobacterium silvisoli]|uniref:hypothetical protein n=1 Tax=Flavobacterium silvisoli TaxID=2529433 RepID=UPI0018738051|nr:hypothetical protein [Flavobacterium silvisoli]